MFHGIAESGYYGLPTTGFRDYSVCITELNWQQSLVDNHVHFVVGKVDQPIILIFMDSLSTGKVFLDMALQYPVQ